MKHHPDIDKVFVYTRAPYESKYWYLIKKREKVDLKHFNDQRTFMEYSYDMKDIYSSTEEYNPRKEWQILIVFDDMISDMISEKKTSPNSH